MTDSANKALLPTGLRDVLPPDATREAHAVDRLMSAFACHGYERVKPPLIEFEESLLDGPGAATATDTFRVMDPVSQRMMGLRADMTMQVARIATSRLSHAPRPLRLAYAGQVLRVKGDQIRPERQFTQVGVELIGSDAPAADAEVIILVASALDGLGVEGVSVDLGLPSLVPTLCDDLDLSQDTRARLRAMLDQKDVTAVRGLGAEAAALFGELIGCVGPADEALARLRALDLPRAAAGRRDRLEQVVRLVQAGAPGIGLTVDPVENRGFEYHTGVSFSLFAARARGELGRGGRYRAGVAREKATGASLFIDAVTDVLPPLPAPRRLLLAAADRGLAARFHAEGWVTVAVLDDGVDLEAEARRLRCSHYTAQGAVKAVAPGSERG
ncbi:ATP phosphoribosyltransferase regulatory subunit [Novispirillum sp. DQ9]|uniref:ATP phosphoribosyltransferase regulatory subunit n=1 Tax=Novispirillum sp. DQ9 TaxID=3398612 RepID=UPI003C79B2B2